MTDTQVWIVAETDGYDSYEVRGVYSNEKAADDHVAYIDLTNERPDGGRNVDYGITYELTLRSEFTIPEPEAKPVDPGHPYKVFDNAADFIVHIEAEHGGFLPHYEESVRQEIANDEWHRRSLHGMLHGQTLELD